MPDARPLVSVVLPTYNRASFLPEAVASVRRQRYERLEMIVVDDGSTDGTGEVLRSLRGADLRYLCQHNQGPSAARNAGLAVARGEVVGFIDADDLWPADKLASQLPALVEDPTADVAHGRTQALVLTGSAADGEERFEPFAEPWYSTQLGSALYRRGIFARVGGFDPGLEPSEDFDWFLRAREQGARVVRTPEIALLYRFHHTNSTRGAGNLHLLATIKRSLDRRRARAGGPHCASPAASPPPPLGGDHS